MRIKNYFNDFLISKLETLESIKKEHKKKKKRQ